MSSSLRAPEPGNASALDVYENLGAVGEGSYGLVLKCRHRPTGQLVALKKFIDTDEDRAVRKIAAREIRFLRSLNHDNVVTLLDVFKRNRRLYLVFEYVEFSLLDCMERSGGGLAPAHVRKYLFQILRALAFMHDAHVIHRDLKPENILLTEQGFVKLCDFGFARSVSTAYSRCYTEYVSTRWYRSPELLIGDTRYGKPIDMWAFGCLIPEMINSQPLYPGSSDVDQLYQIVRSCGELCPRHLQIVRKNPAFAGWKWPRQKEKYMVDRRIKNKSLLKIAKECLRMDPAARFTCKQVMACDYFRDSDFQAEFANELRRMIRKHRAKNPHLRRYSIVSDAAAQNSDNSTAPNQRRASRQSNPGPSKAQNASNSLNGQSDNSRSKVFGKASQGSSFAAAPKDCFAADLSKLKAQLGSDFGNASKGLAGTAPFKLPKPKISVDKQLNAKDILERKN